ncbi:hypothetical protein ACMFMG_000699 [Clarireedia jacksonii]
MNTHAYASPQTTVDPRHVFGQSMQQGISPMADISLMADMSLMPDMTLMQDMSNYYSAPFFPPLPSAMNFGNFMPPIATDPQFWNFDPQLQGNNMQYSLDGPLTPVTHSGYMGPPPLPSCATLPTRTPLPSQVPPRSYAPVPSHAILRSQASLPLQAPLPARTPLPSSSTHMTSIYNNQLPLNYDLNRAFYVDRSPFNPSNNDSLQVEGLSGGDMDGGDTVPNTPVHSGSETEGLDLPTPSSGKRVRFEMSANKVWVKPADEQHTEFAQVVVHTAKCDVCGRRNTSVLQRCTICNKQFDQECCEAISDDGIHKPNLEALDWTARQKPNAKTRPNFEKNMNVSRRRGTQRYESNLPPGERIRLAMKLPTTFTGRVNLGEGTTSSQPGDSSPLPARVPRPPRARGAPRARLPRGGRGGVSTRGVALAAAAARRRATEKELTPEQQAEVDAMLRRAKMGAQTPFQAHTEVQRNQAREYRENESTHDNTRRFSLPPLNNFQSQHTRLASVQPAPGTQPPPFVPRSHANKARLTPNYVGSRSQTRASTNVPSEESSETDHTELDARIAELRAAQDRQLRIDAENEFIDDMRNQGLHEQADAAHAAMVLAQHIQDAAENDDFNDFNKINEISEINETNETNGPTM